MLAKANKTHLSTLFLTPQKEKQAHNRFYWCKTSDEGRKTLHLNKYDPNLAANLSKTGNNSG